MAIVTCHGPDCEVEFEAKSTAKYHAEKCRKAAARARASSKTEAPIDQVDGADQKPTAETEYGRAVLDSVRADLTKAGQLNSPRGRVALYLARKSIDPDCKNPAAMFKQMLEALDAAVAAGAAVDGPAEPAPAEPDKVADIRKKREQKAAGQASTG